MDQNPNIVQSILNKKDDESKIGPALNKIQLEDPSVEVKRNNETKQQLLGGLSNSHIDYIIDKLKNLYRIEVTTEPSDLASVADALEGMGYELKQREAAMVPNNYTRVDDPDTLKKLALLFDNLEEDDDVQNVWNNLENSEDLPEL